MDLFPKGSCHQVGSAEEDETTVEYCSSFGYMLPGFSISPGITSASELFNVKETSSRYSTFLCKESAVMSMTGMQQSSLPLNTPSAAVAVTCSPFLLQSLHNIKTTPGHYIAASSDVEYSALEYTSEATETDVIYCLPGAVIAHQLEDTVCVGL
jgi:hypothetical protein